MEPERKIDSDAADTLVYEASAFSGPRNVVINGVRLNGVQEITTRQVTQDFSEVTIVLRGTHVNIETPRT